MPLMIPKKFKPKIKPKLPPHRKLPTGGWGNSNTFMADTGGDDDERKSPAQIKAERLERQAAARAERDKNRAKYKAKFTAKAGQIPNFVIPPKLPEVSYVPGEERRQARQEMIQARQEMIQGNRPMSYYTQLLSSLPSGWGMGAVGGTRASTSTGTTKLPPVPITTQTSGDDRTDRKQNFLEQNTPKYSPGYGATEEQIYKDAEEYYYANKEEIEKAVWKEYEANPEEFDAAAESYGLTTEEYLDLYIQPESWPKGVTFYDVILNYADVDENGELVVDKDGNLVLPRWLEEISGQKFSADIAGEGWTREDLKPIWKKPAEYLAEMYGLGAQGIDFANSGLPGPNVPRPEGIKVQPVLDVTPEVEDEGDGGGGGDGGGEWTNRGGDGGGGNYPYPETPKPIPTPKVKWVRTYAVAGAPTWWQGLTPDGALTPELEYAMLMNSMIPYMSIEDQRSTAQNLFILFPEVFSMYNSAVTNLGTPAPLGEFVSEDYTSKFYSKQRAQAMLDTLNTVKSKVKKGSDVGPGYHFLTQIASNLRDFGGPTGGLPTRQSILNLLGALDPLLGLTEGDTLSAFGPMAKNISTPFMAAGRVLPVSKLESGEYSFGEPNRSYF